MKGADKFLGGIVLGIALLVLVSVVLVMTRPPPAYREDNSAENVAYNYLLALEQRNYARAYVYLSPSLRSYPPSIERFISDIQDNAFNVTDESVSLEIASSRAIVASPELSEVAVRSTRFTGGGLFGPSQYSALFRMDLQKEDGGWKIIRSDQYWASCWTRAAGCQ